MAVTSAWHRPWAIAPVVPLLYAITDEIHQGSVAGRHESAVDVGIDLTAAVVTVAVVGVVLAAQRGRGRASSGRPVA